MTAKSRPGAAVSFAALAILAAGGAAQATNGTTSSSVSAINTATPMPTDISITGDPSPTLPGDGAIVLDGDYAVSAGGTRATAVLGAVTFDPAGTIVGGTLSFIGASRISPAPSPSSSNTGTGTTTLTPAVVSTSTTTTGDTLGGSGTLGGGDTLGGGLTPSDPGTSGTATVTDCTVTGGTYSLASGGGGEAQLQLDCAGTSLPATWRLFVTETQGMAVAQQFRAVQLEALPGAVDAEIADLTLTLR